MTRGSIVGFHGKIFPSVVSGRQEGERCQDDDGSGLKGLVILRKLEIQSRTDRLAAENASPVTGEKRAR